MKIITGTVINFLLVVSTLAQTNVPCRTTSLQGECVSFNSCAYTSILDGFVHQEIVKEFKERTSACQSHGQNLICCEKISSTEKPLTLMVSSPKPVTTTESSTSRLGDPQSHKNYKYFQNLKCGSSTIDRVAFGQNANLFDYPWAAQLGYENDGVTAYKCGASLISDFYVLTAAHCLLYLRGGDTLKTVRLGEYNTSSVIDCDINWPDDCAEPVQDIAVKSFVAHPKYDRVNTLNDIGLVQMDQAANFRHNNIKPICLPFSTEAQTLPDRFLVVGWGATETSRSSEVLQMASLPLFAQDICFRKYSELLKKRKFVLTKRQFCAGGEGKTDSCRGDSGSAIQAFGPSNGKFKMILYGIVSFGVAACGVDVGFPGVYTRVSDPDYLLWILDNMES